MSSPSSLPGVLIVCDPEEAAALGEPLRQPMSTGPVRAWTAHEPAAAVALFTQHRPEVLLVTASLRRGDPGQLIEQVRGMIGRAEVAIVMIGTLDGPMSTALDTAELGGDRFLSRPVSPKALRYAVSVSIDAARLARGGRASSGTVQEIDDDPTGGYRQAQRARWARLADSITDPGQQADLEARTEARIEARIEEPAAPPPTPLVIRPRRHSASIAVVTPDQRSEESGKYEELGERGAVAAEPRHPAGPSSAPARSSAAPARATAASVRSPGAPVRAFTARPSGESLAALSSLSSLPGGRDDEGHAAPPAIDTPPGRTRPMMVPAAAAAPPSLASSPSPASPPSLASSPSPASPPSLSLPSPPPQLETTPPPSPDRPEAPATLSSDVDDAVWSAPELLAQLHEATADVSPVATPPAVPAAPPPPSPPGREFARQLRQKMSAMAQRLFAHPGGGGPALEAALDAAPRHDHQIEFDLAALVEEPALSDTPEIVALRTSITPVFRETQPGSWDGGRERSVPDAGDLVRGVCDAPAIVVRMWTMAATGRVTFFRGDTEKIVFFDQGRPVFASSTELHDRMGELLYREGKITHGQYMHSKSLVAESGRRMGEVLVELGYLKRRELYPAVRRHIEDIIYSLFAWDHGTYRVSLDERPTTERIRLARHPEAVVLEGIRRKLDRAVLERLVGPPSTVLELHDRERLAGLAATIELSTEERAALAAIDGQADLPVIARAAGMPVAAVLPLAWALIVLGYVTARRDSAEPLDEAAQVGESDLAIDRERVRARWQLVAEADYFALLGVRRDATSFEIRRAYEASRRDFAAEGFPGELRHELARELDDIATVLDEAFRVLRDDPLRREYLAHLVD